MGLYRLVVVVVQAGRTKLYKLAKMVPAGNVGVYKNQKVSRGVRGVQTLDQLQRDNCTPTEELITANGKISMSKQ